MKASFMRSCAAAIVLASLAGAPAWAAKSADLTPEQSAAVDKIVAFINGFRDLQGEFTQVGPKGTVSKGVFFLSKPGKMRFEYDSPNPYVIVSDGRWVTIKNRAKERADQYPLSQTPLRLILADDVDLAKETRILGVEQADSLTTITLEDRKGMVPGQLVLTFDSERQALQQWIVVDGQGRRTTVSLENIQAGVSADPKLFVIKVTRDNAKKN